MKIIIFDVINHEEFLKGEDEVLKMREIGPIVYREHLRHENITFHSENDTMSFTAVRSVEFLEEENEPGILNRTIIVPNLSILAMASRLNDAPFFMKIGFNMLLRSSNDSVFQNTTIYKYLWDMDGQLMRLGEKLVPFMVPVDNYGILHTIYKSFTDRQNVKIGTAHGHEHFFEMNLYNDRPTVPGFLPERGDCFATIENSTEGLYYPQRLTNESVLMYWRKTICRPSYLHYTEDVSVGGIPGKKYVLPDSTYDRTNPLEGDCYRGEGEPVFPDGLSDASKCYHGFPIVISKPHFLNRTGDWVKRLEGITPSEEAHGSYVIVEPLTGVPLKECARSQSNIFIHQLSGFSNPDLQQKLRMRPLLPPFEWWKNPPPTKMKIIIFDVINHEEFLKGEDEVLKMREIGPIVYREHLRHENITFHSENDTMSFTAVRSVEFLEDENEPGILNRTIIVPNLSILAMASRLNDAPFFMKIGFNMLLRSSNDSVFQNTTIYKYLWDMDGQLMRLGEKLVPFMVPVDNYGILHTIYKSFTDRQNVKIGTAHGHEHFFEMNLYNDRPTVPGFLPERGDCFATIVNSTEGLYYPQRLTNESVLMYWRKTICRPSYLHYTEDVSVGGIPGKKYVLPDSTYDRTDPLEGDCYRGEGEPVFPDGLSDASKCYHGFPIAISKPHFLNRTGDWVKKLEGMTPSEEAHGSFIIAEPLTGVPLRECARSQSNIFVSKLSGFSNPDLMRFSEMVVPMIWLEYVSDCYRGEGEPVFPDGLSDASKCYHGFPIVISKPHFLNRTGDWVKRLEGIAPSEEAHGSYVIVEPLTGVPLKECARSQSNIFIHQLSGFSNPDLQRFSGMVVPMFWGDICIEELPLLIEYLMIFVVVWVPTLQPIGTFFAYIFGIMMLLYGLRQLHRLNLYTVYDSFAKVNFKHSKVAVEARALISLNAIQFSVRCLSTIIFLSIGLTFIIAGIVATKISIRDLMLDEKLRMRPLLPPYQWWKNPQPIVRLRLFIFDVINHEEFLKGEDEVLKMREIGPIVYREHLRHENITFHSENDTMSFTAVRSVEFLEDENEPGILNRTIIVPNLSILAMASRLNDAPFFMKIGFNMLLRSSNDSVFQNTTIYKYLWDMDGQLMRLGEKLVPFMVPVDNYGILHTIYKSFTDRQNVKIGTAHGHEHFFEMNLYNDRPTVPGFLPERGDCFATIENSTEGLYYPQRLTNESVLMYWRKTICRPSYLHYTEDVSVGGIPGKKYVLPDSTYDRTDPLEGDCYRGEGEPVFPDGLSDASKCYHGFPIAISKPHFLNRTGDWVKKLEGMTPSEEAHGSFIIAEPLTGVPLRECARSQSNIFVSKLSGFSNPDLMRFSEMVVPMIWLEYCMLELTPLINLALSFVVLYMEPLQYVGSMVCLALGSIALLLVALKLLCN
uniref:Plasma membrane glycoprotein cd36 n=1 Tax=Lutzomyia longipalpis TaxID=7200 RepID=A0A1B0CMS0_LUTLO